MRRPLLVIASLGAVLVAGATILVLAATPTGRTGTFDVAVGEGTASVIERLKTEGHVRSTTLFRIALKRSGRERQIQPGTYDLGAARTFDELIGLLSSGGVAADEVVVTLLEGWSLRELAVRLQAAGLIAAAPDLYRWTGEPAGDYRTRGNFPFPDLRPDFPALADKPSWAALEGYLFPDTYRFFRDASPEEVVRTLLGNFERKLTPELRAEIAAQDKTIFEFVIMASIIEREVRGADDRALVSDLFWRRLVAGMPLQADSTVNYATGKSLAAVTLDDTAVESGYNTYKYPGLPIGPISNPGQTSLLAAVRPRPNPYWYFLTDDAGTVHYAKTFEEHLANKRKYLSR